MDDNIKIEDQQIGTSQPKQTQQQTGSVNKEMEPSGSFGSEIKPSGPEINHELSQELRDIEIKETKDRPDLTEEHKKMGISHAGESTPVQTQPSGSIQFPMSDQEIEHKLSGKNDDSGKWLATLIEKVKSVMGL